MAYLRLIRSDRGKHAAKEPLPKPWLDVRGFPLSKDALRDQSQTWSPETWETYLQSLEVSRRENLGVSKDRQLILEEQARSEGGAVASILDLFEHEPERSSFRDQARAITYQLSEDKGEKFQDEDERIQPHDEKGISHFSQADLGDDPGAALQKAVELAMRVLTANESLVIWRLFWDGRTEREIGVMMRRSRRTIRTWKERAFEKLRLLLSPIYLIIEGAALPKADRNSSSGTIEIAVSRP